MRISQAIQLESADAGNTVACCELLLLEMATLPPQCCSNQEQTIN